MSKGAVVLSDVKENIERNTATLGMQAKLRQAIFDSISEKDVSSIVRKQVEKAKSGDERSLQFVMKYVLGFGQPITLQQINVTDVETAAKLARGK